MFSANVFIKSKTISGFILNGASVCEFVYYFHVIYYDLFIKKYFETSHAKGPQNAAGGFFLKNQVDLAVYRGSEIIQSASDFFNYCENHLKDTKST
jgi:hypothetical protein